MLRFILALLATMSLVTAPAFGMARAPSAYSQFEADYNAIGTAARAQGKPNLVLTPLYQAYENIVQRGADTAPYYAERAKVCAQITCPAFPVK